MFPAYGLAMLTPGDLFAGHLIDAHAGGAVYRAIETGTERTVALKLVEAPPPVFAHPSVVEVYAAGDDFVTMRWITGPTLAELLRNGGRLEAGHARAIAGQLTAALRAAHAAGIVHGNVKPSNILLEGDHAYLSDFQGSGTPADDLAHLRGLAL
jgi:serine/threonine protein kinase